MASDKFAYIQVLRAIAATSVVVIHATSTSVQYTTGPSLAIEPAKYLAFGVDLFFVITGAIIYITTTRSGLSATEFSKRRLQRIVPLYWLLTILFFLCLLVVPGLKAASTSSLPKLLASLGFVSFAGWDTPVIYPGWSLEYEMLFYGLTSTALAIRRSRPWGLVALVVCTATLLHPWFAGQSGSTLSFLTNPIALSFVGGIMVAQWSVAGRPGAAETVAFSVALLVAGANEPMQRAIYAGLPSAALVFFAIKGESTTPTPPHWLIKLGDASYAIYLLHVFAIAVVGKLLHRFQPSLDADALAAMMTASALLAGLAVHQWVELPMMSLIKRRGARAAPVWLARKPIQPFNQHHD